MKKISILLAVSLIAAILTVSVLADSGSDAGFSGEVKKAFTIEAIDYDDFGDNANTALQASEDGSGTSLSMKPLDESTPEGCYFEFAIKIAEPCDEICFTFQYAASKDRFMDVTFNSQTTKLTCPSTDGWELFSDVSIVFKDIKAGDYTLRIAAPSDFNNDTIKTPNIDIIFYDLYTAPVTEAPVTEAPVTEAPVTEAPVTEAAATEVASVAPQTFDAAVIIVLSAIVSASGAIAIKAKRK